MVQSKISHTAISRFADRHPVRSDKSRMWPEPLRRPVPDIRTVAGVAAGGVVPNVYIYIYIYCAATGTRACHVVIVIVKLALLPFVLRCAAVLRCRPAMPSCDALPLLPPPDGGGFPRFLIVVPDASLMRA
jgi:hypothetical protein